MIETARGLSFVAYAYEGGPRRFTITFPYLKSDHVRVLVGDPKSPRTVVPVWVNSTTLEIPDQTDLLLPPFTVQLRRNTPISKQAIEFQNGAKLPASELNVSFQQLLYRQQELVEFGLDGNGMPNGGLPGGGVPGPIGDIQTIIDAVIQSPAFEAATGLIPNEDANAELIMAEILRSDAYFEVNRDLTNRVSEAVQRITLVEESDRVLAEEYTSLVASLGRTNETIAAQYLSINQALATETEARAASMTALTADFHGAIASTYDEINALATATETSVTRIEQNQAQYGQALAATKEDLKIVSDANGANTTWRQMFAAQWGSGTNGQSVAAAVKSQIETKATPEEARAIAAQSVTTFSNGTFAALKESFNSYVGSNNGKWEATWAIQINGGDPRNPVVAGIALGATGAGSDFVVNSDRFAITNTTYGARKFPFVVGTVGGVSTVGITGQLLVDGSITAHKIRVDSLAALTANAGTINGGTFKTHTLDANGNVTNPLEFRVEVSNEGAWPLWVGTGVKNQNNAVFWVDRQGNAGFDGLITAPNIRGAFQRHSLVNWQGSRTAEADSTLTAFILEPPALAGEYHTPIINLSVGIQGNHSNNGVGTVAVQRLEGGTWVNVVVTQINQGEHMVNHAIVGIDAATSSHQTYRVQFLNVQNGVRLIARSVTGVVTGLR
jgi:hypothetical protein